MLERTLAGKQSLGHSRWTNVHDRHGAMTMWVWTCLNDENWCRHLFGNPWLSSSIFFCGSNGHSCFAAHHIANQWLTGKAHGYCQNFLPKSPSSAGRGTFSSTWTRKLWPRHTSTQYSTALNHFVANLAASKLFGAILLVLVVLPAMSCASLSKNKRRRPCLWRHQWRPQASADLNNQRAVLCDLSQLSTVGQLQSVSTTFAPLDYWILHHYGFKQDAVTQTFWDAQSAGQLLPSSVSFTSAESVEPSARKLLTRTLLRKHEVGVKVIGNREWAQNGLLQVVRN